MPQWSCRRSPPHQCRHQHARHRHTQQAGQPDPLRCRTVVAAHGLGHPGRPVRPAPAGPASHQRQHQQRRRQHPQLDHQKLDHPGQALASGLGHPRLRRVGHRAPAVRGHPGHVRCQHQQRDHHRQRQPLAIRGTRQRTRAPHRHHHADQRQRGLVFRQHRQPGHHTDQCPAQGLLPRRTRRLQLRGPQRQQHDRRHADHQHRVVVEQLRLAHEALLQAGEQHGQPCTVLTDQPARDAPGQHQVQGNAAPGQHGRPPRMQPPHADRGGQQPARQRRVLVVAPLHRLCPGQLLEVVPVLRRVGPPGHQHPDQHQPCGQQRGVDQPTRRDRPPQPPFGQPRHRPPTGSGGYRRGLCTGTIRTAVSRFHTGIPAAAQHCFTNRHIDTFKARDCA